MGSEVIMKVKISLISIAVITIILSVFIFKLSSVSKNISEVIDLNLKVSDFKGTVQEFEALVYKINIERTAISDSLIQLNSYSANMQNASEELFTSLNKHLEEDSQYSRQLRNISSLYKHTDENIGSLISSLEGLENKNVSKLFNKMDFYTIRNSTRLFLENEEIKNEYKYIMSYSAKLIAVNQTISILPKALTDLNEYNYEKINNYSNVYKFYTGIMITLVLLLLCLSTVVTISIMKEIKDNTSK